MKLITQHLCNLFFSEPIVAGSRLVEVVIYLFEIAFLQISEQAFALFQDFQIDRTQILLGSDKFGINLLFGFRKDYRGVALLS